mmetsp:Transcript_1995/g.3480  ORF Transcript_1995/g.3480 Transcript_1995/m.3480 type:complete len:426 (+) Transcript_1995:24-1301(+)
MHACMHGSSARQFVSWCKRPTHVQCNDEHFTTYCIHNYYSSLLFFRFRRFGYFDETIGDISRNTFRDSGASFASASNIMHPPQQHPPNESTLSAPSLGLPIPPPPPPPPPPSLSSPSVLRSPSGSVSVATSPSRRASWAPHSSRFERDRSLVHGPPDDFSEHRKWHQGLFISSSPTHSGGASTFGAGEAHSSPLSAAEKSARAYDNFDSFFANNDNDEDGHNDGHEDGPNHYQPFQSRQNEPAAPTSSFIEEMRAFDVRNSGRPVGDKPVAHVASAAAAVANLSTSAAPALMSSEQSQQQQLGEEGRSVPQNTAGNLFMEEPLLGNDTGAVVVGEEEAALSNYLYWLEDQHLNSGGGGDNERAEEADERNPFSPPSTAVGALKVGRHTLPTALSEDDLHQQQQEEEEEEEVPSSFWPRSTYCTPR